VSAADDELFADDVTVRSSGLTEPTRDATLLIKRRLEARDGPGEATTAPASVPTKVGPERATSRIVSRAEPPPDLEKRFPRPRRLDVGAGTVRERGWVSLDDDPTTRPHLLMDAHELRLPDESVDQARMTRALSVMREPRLVLIELWRVLTRGAVLTVRDVAPGADLTVLPGTRHELTDAFWSDVTRLRPHRYVPSGARGRWELRRSQRDFTAVGERLAWKLKLTRDEVLSTFRNVSHEQVVELVKVRC